MSDGLDLDEFLDEYVEGLRGNLMQAFGSLHESIEETVDAMQEGSALANLDEAIRRVEAVEHVLMEARAIESLRASLDAEEDG